MGTAIRHSSDYLAHASLELSSSLDYETTLGKVADLALDTLADWCAVHVHEAGEDVRPVLVRHRDPARAERAREIAQRFPLNPDAPTGVAQVLRTGRAERISPITTDHLRSWSTGPDHLEFLQDARLSSAVIVPLRAQGRLVGALSLLYAESGLLHSPQDLALAEGLAEHAAVAIENARLYRQAKEENDRRARSEEALRQSERRFRALFEGALSGVFVIDDFGHFVDVNPAACALTGYQREDLLDRGLRDLTPKGERKALLPQWETLRVRGKLEGDASILRKDGAVRVIEFSAVAHFMPRLHLAFVRDVTERRRAEDTFRMLNRELEARVEERTRELETALREMEAFSYTVAHDLRAPLRAMTSFSQVLREDHLSPADAAGLELATRLEQSARRMDSLVQDLLSYSRLSREDLPLDRVDLNLMVPIVIDQMSAYLESRGAQVSVDPDLPPVMAHPLALSRVLANLLENAAKFVPAGRVPRIWIGGRRREGRVQVVVEDNGIGIAPEYHEKIFGLFQRLNRSEEFPGTGIGLAIVKKAVEKMGGTVVVESRLGEGSRFMVQLQAC